MWGPINRCSARLRNFLISIVAKRRDEIASICVLQDPWPIGLDPAKIPWRVRTRNVLERSGLPTSESSLSKVTFRDLFALRGMGAISVLDFACTSEAAIDSVSMMEQTVDPLDQEKSDAGKRGKNAEAQNVGDQAQAETNRRNANIRDILAATAQESWSHRVSELDPRFAPLLPPGAGTVFERIDALFSGLPTAFFSDESALEASIHKVRAKIERMGAMRLEDALRGYLRGLSRVSGARLDALVARFGWGGRPPLTLEEAGAKAQLTRERIRQIQARTLTRVPPHAVIMPALDRALDLLQANAPLSPDAAALLLAKERVANRPFHPLGVLEAAAVCGRTPTFEIARARGRELVVSNPLQGIANAVIQTAFIQAGASGVSNVLEVTEECNQNGMKVSESQVRQVLRGLSDAQFLADDWFWRPNGLADRNRLRNVTRRILCVSSPVSVAVLREGVRREYTVRRARGSAKWRLVVPPRNVMEAFYRANPEFRVDEAGLVSPSEPLDYRFELNRTEQTLLLVLRSSPTCLLDRTAFARGCIARGMNENTFSIFSSYSPIVAHLGTGLWTLRGVHVIQQPLKP